VYEPSTRPGSPLPHAWIDDEDGNRRALRDLVAPGRFLLVAGEGWCEAARALVADADVPMTRSGSAIWTAICTTRGVCGSGAAV
jgi:2,4-dichlorophenol 6-monooxygenase